MAAAEEKQQQTLALTPPPPPKQGEKSEELGENQKQQLAPWEQHASVIHLPRYDYRASSSFLLRPHSAFLITCPIKREKSATKEAISLLHEFTDNVSSHNSKSLKSCDANIMVKKRKISGSSDVKSSNDIATDGNVDDGGSTGKAIEESSASSKTCEENKCSPDLSLVKLSSSGLLLFAFPDNGCHPVVHMLQEVLLSLQAGKLKSPQWCHRILPIQETCILSEARLLPVVSKLFREFLGDERKFDKPIKFAAGFNRRGIDEMEAKPQKDNESLNQSALMDREHCFSVVAAAVKTVAKNAVVDLKSPEVAVLVEVLPISGVPYGSPVVGVSVVPSELISTKPRLCIKPLVSTKKVTKRKSKVE